MSRANETEQIVSTDGSCLDQANRAKRRAGYAVFFGAGDARNVSEPVTGDKHTNQVGELMAVTVALERSDPARPLLIISDSEYAIRGLFGMDGDEPWYKKWLKNGWRNAARKPVANRALWERALAVAMKRTFRMKWQKAHAGHAGNEGANTLARAGAARAVRSKKTN